MTLTSIRNDIQNYFQVEDISIKNRQRRYRMLRALFYTLCKQMCEGVSLEQIGKEMNGRTHATVINGIKRFSSELRYEPKIKYFYENYKATRVDLIVHKVDLVNGILI